MVRAILDGRKTVTRRICKDGNDYVVPDMSFYDADKRTYAVHNYADKEHEDKLSLVERTCPICPGDILYVRETWGISNFDYDNKTAYIVYKASENERDEGCRAVRLPDDKFEKLYDSMEENSPDWRPSIHMPKEAARIWLKVTDVRVQQIKDMTLDDFLCEGITLQPEAYNDPGNAYQQAKGAFLELIKCIYPDCTEDSWFWVIEFERCERPECKSCLCQRCDNNDCVWCQCQKNSMKMECYTNDCDYYCNEQEEIDEGFLDGYGEL